MNKCYQIPCMPCAQTCESFSPFLLHLFHIKTRKPPSRSFQFSRTITDQEKKKILTKFQEGKYKLVISHDEYRFYWIN